MKENLKQIITDIPESLVEVPCGRLNENTYKASLLENIRQNLERLNK